MKMDKELAAAVKHELKKGTKKLPYAVYDLSDGFDLCRAYNRPICVRPNNGDEAGQIWKVYPSGNGDLIDETTREDRIRARLKSVGWSV